MSKVVLNVKILQGPTTAPVSLDISGMALIAKVCYLTLAFFPTCFLSIKYRKVVRQNHESKCNS